MVDSGASSNFIDMSFLSQKEQEECSKIHGSVHLADGTRIKLYGTLERTLKLGAYTLIVAFKVIDLKGRYDAVLGKTWLAQANPYINWRQNTIRVRQGGKVIRLAAIERFQGPKSTEKRSSTAKKQQSKGAPNPNTNKNTPEEQTLRKNRIKS